jgi:hypothetical protein
VDVFCWKVWPPNPKKLIFEYSSKELHFFFFLLWTSNHQTQLSVMRQNKSLARTLHLVLIALRGFSVYILFSLVFLCRRVCTVLSASHAQYAHSTAHGVQATANKRHEQRTGAGKGREPSQAKGGGFWEREKEGTTASSHRDGEQQCSKLTSR